MTYTEAQAISADGFDDVLHSQVYDKVPILVKLKSMKKVMQGGGGDNWTWTVRIRKFGRANAVDPRADIVYINKETRTEIVDVPRYYEVNNVLPWDKLRANKSKSKKIDLIRDATEELKEDMNDRIGTDIYTANPNGNGITPLETIIDATATYGGLAYNDADIDTGAWNSTEDSTTTKLELFGDYSLSYYKNATTYGGNGPNFHVTTKDLKSTFESILESQKVYQVNAKRAEKTMADAGFDTVLFKGDPVTADPYCPANAWWGIDIDALSLLYDPEYYFVTTPWEKLGSEQQYALKKNYAAVIQLKCIRRRTSFKMTALDASLV